MYNVFFENSGHFYEKFYFDNLNPENSQEQEYH